MRSIRKTNRRARRNAHQARRRVILALNDLLIAHELSLFGGRTLEDVGKALALGHEQFYAKVQERRNAE